MTHTTAATPIIPGLYQDFPTEQTDASGIRTVQVIPHHDWLALQEARYQAALLPVALPGPARGRALGVAVAVALAVLPWLAWSVCLV